MYLVAIQRLLLDAVLDIFIFPVWWYSRGAWRSVKWCWTFFESGNHQFAPGLWLKNIFVPMYGQSDWEGRIISFFMRLAQVLARSFVTYIWLMVCLIIFLFWLSLPLVAFYGLYHSLRS